MPALKSTKLVPQGKKRPAKRLPLNKQFNSLNLNVEKQIKRHPLLTFPETMDLKYRFLKWAPELHKNLIKQGLIDKKVVDVINRIALCKCTVDSGYKELWEYFLDKFNGDKKKAEKYILNKSKHLRKIESLDFKKDNFIFSEHIIFTEISVLAEYYEMILLKQKKIKKGD